jgi:hypothetical protein
LLSSNKFRFLVEWITDGFTQIHLVDIQIKPTLLVEQHIALKKTTDPSAASKIIFKRHHSKLAQK